MIPNVTYRAYSSDLNNRKSQPRKVNFGTLEQEAILELQRFSRAGNRLSPQVLEDARRLHEYLKLLGVPSLDAKSQALDGIFEILDKHAPKLMKGARAVAARKTLVAADIPTPPTRFRDRFRLPRFLRRGKD